MNCPLDGSPLLSGLGSSSGCKHGFCPVCAVAFLFSGRPGEPSTTLKWKLVKGDLEPLDPGQPLILDRDLRVDLANLRHGLRLFLEHRENRLFQARCLLDGGKVQVVAEDVVGTVPVTVTWCGSCALGFVATFDPLYAWEHAATFLWAQATNRYLLDPTRHPLGRASRLTEEQLAGVIAELAAPSP